MDKKRVVTAGALGLFTLLIFTMVRRLDAPVEIVDEATIAEPVAYADVLVAAIDLPFGTVIGVDNLKWAKWPVDAVSDQFIVQYNSAAYTPEEGEEASVTDTQTSAMDDVLEAVVRTTIYSGEPILEQKLVRAGDSGVLAALLRPGMRAVATAISVDTTAGGFIRPGDRVDIILTEEVEVNSSTNTGATEAQFVAKTIFENVRIMAIDQTYGSAQDGEAAVIGSTATFEMTQGDAEILRESAAKGDITLTLRGINEARNVQALSAAKVSREQPQQSSQITVYRDGRPQYVAIRGN